MISLLVLALLTGPSSALSGQQDRPREHARVDREGIPRVLSGLQERVSGSTPREVASLYLRERTAELRLDAISLDVNEARVIETASGSHISIAQTFHGIPVFRGGVVITTTADNEIRMVANDVVYGLDPRGTHATVSSEQALAIAHRHLSASGPPIELPSATLFIYRAPGGGDHLAYRVTATLNEPYGDWEIFVDAQTGQVLNVTDLFVQAHGSEYVQGLGAVYRSDPLSEVNGTYGDPGLLDNDDADSDILTAARAIVPLDSLRVEDGLVMLAGPFCTVTEIEAPADPVAFTESSPDAFRYSRSHPAFEAVMAYYHAATAYRRLQELGFEIPRLRTLRLDPHGYHGQDNSHYSPSGNWISFGTGGVDDAEDADVIWHEYGHAIVYSLIPYWGGGEAAALGEGYSDYWAASYSRSLGQWQPNEPPYQWIFKWDGHNVFWSGRILNAPGTYPFGSLGIHAAGQLWASALMGIHDDLGRDITDRLVLRSLFSLGSSPTAQDAALAILQADRDLYGGAHEVTLFHWLGTVKRFLPEDPEMRILVIADDGVVPADSERAGLTEQPPVVLLHPGQLPFSSLIETLSVPQGYSVHAVNWATMDTADLGGCPLVVLAGGQNPRPFDDPTKRAAILRYAAGGGRVLVEGGEVGFAYAARQEYELDSDFRRSVLHLGEHGGDLLGAEFVPDFSASAVFSTPHAISASLEFYEPASYAQRDLALPEPADLNTSVLGGWSAGQARGGLLLHRSPGGGATLLVPFSFSALRDSVQACMLMENLLTFMLSPSLPATPVAETDGGVPASTLLHQNYPNPFNPTTTIRFELGGEGAEYNVSIEIFDELGRLVSTPIRGGLARGVHEVRFDATSFPSGAYFYRLTSAGRHGANPTRLIRRMLLVR